MSDAGRDVSGSRTAEAAGRSRTVATGLGPLAVRTVGTGPAALLWHSLFADGRSWDGVVPALAARRTCHVVDGPGHGASPGPDRRFTLEECADAAVAVLDGLAVDDVDWIGNAWGGHVGVLVAVRAPARVRSLAAICSPMQALEPPARRKAQLLARLLGLLGWRGFVRRAVRGALLAPTAPASVVAELERELTGPGRRRTLHAVRSVMLGRPSLVGELAAIECRALFATTRGSESWPEAIAQDHAARLRRGRFEVLTGARHLPPLETPAAVAELLTGWLATV